MTGQGAQLADVQLVVADWYRKRLGTYFRRTLNQGLGAYLIFAVSLTVALISARLAWVGGMEDRRYVSDLMKTEVQPQSEASRGVVLSLLLSGLDTSPLSEELYCNGPKVGACSTGTKLWMHTQALIDSVEQAQSDPDERDLLIQKTASDIDAAAPGQHLESLTKQLTDNVDERARLLSAASAFDLDLRARAGDLCGDFEEIDKRARMFFLSAPFCISNAAGVTIEVVPQQVADAINIPTARTDEVSDSQSDVANTNAPTSGDSAAVDLQVDVRRLRDYRVLRAQLDSEIFEIAVASMRDKLLHSHEAESDSPGLEDSEEDEAPRTKRGPTITAAFFISVDSVIRYWARTSDVKTTILPAHRLWATRPYFEAMLNKNDNSSAQRTRAYMDFAGHGVVHTECHPLTGTSRLFPSRSVVTQSDGSPGNATALNGEAPKRIVLGAVCVDYALSDSGVNDLIKKIDDGPLADAQRVVFGLGPAGKWLPDRSKDYDWGNTKSLHNALKLAANEIGTNPASRRDILPIDVDGEDASIFLVPLRDRQDGKLDTVVLRVAGVGPLGSRPEAMAVTAVFGAIAIGALLAGFRSSKAVALRERLLGRLRSLQVGVLQTDGKDQITAANDRAEELLDLTLPPFGVQSGEPRKYWKVFDQESILSIKRFDINSLISDWGTEDLELGTEAEIKANRRDGDTTAYFVKLQTKRSSCASVSSRTLGKRENPRSGISPFWLRVTAGPILMPRSVRGGRRIRVGAPGGNDYDETFGVVEPVSTDLGEQLDSILIKLRSKGSVTGADK